MEREQSTPSSSSGLYGGERGAGGKFKKPPARKPPATPYARPPPAQPPILAQRRDGGWLSKLVDPACRLITGGATRIFPSIFSKSPSAPALLLPSTENQDERDKELEQNDDDEDKKGMIDLGTISEGASPDKPADKSLSNVNFNDFGKDKVGNLHDDNDFSKIEQQMKGKIFSRDEINRLMEILNSRAIDISDVQPQKKQPNLSTGGEAEGAILSNGYPKMSIEEKQDGLNLASWGTSTPLLNSTPLLKSTMQDDVGASPIDIAKAYMGCRASEVGPGSYSTRRLDETPLVKSGDFASMQLIPPPSSKPSVCWPGAMLQDQHGYLTPRSQKGKIGLHGFPRTPYSRTLYSNSKSKLTQLQAENNWCQSTLSTPLHRSQTPVCGQVKPRNDVLDIGYGSVGPIRRARHKFMSEARPRGSVSFHASQNGLYKGQSSMSSKDILPAVKKNLESGAPSSTPELQSVGSMTHTSEAGIRTQQASPSMAVRAILEHLDRNKPTPKEISAEMRLATTSEVADVPKEHTSSLHSARLDSRKNTELANHQFSVQGNHDGGNSNFSAKAYQRYSNEGSNALNNNIEAARTVVGNARSIHDSSAGPTVDLKGTADFQLKSTNETGFTGFADNRREGTSQLWSLHHKSNGQDVSKLIPSSSGSEPKKPPIQSSGAKPNLTSLSVAKPDLKWTFNSDNTSGFTFPVSASTGASSEPPTPSIVPSLSATTVPQSKEVPAVPSYTFGTKKSKPALVFSFPSTSSGPNHDDPLDIKFNFGSDKKTRVSFKSVGRNAICL